MNPALSNKHEEHKELKFTLSGVDKSIANSIRRTILANIKTVVIDADECKFEHNNTRLHNELLKERLRGIPVHLTSNLENNAAKFTIEVDITNDTDNVITLTTKDFKIKDNEKGAYLAQKTRNEILPPNEITRHYILFAKLDPFIDKNIEKTRIQFSAPLTVKTASENSSHVVASTCSYMNTQDDLNIKETWTKREETLRQELNRQNLTEAQISARVKFEHNDYTYLDAQRQYVPNSFDFVLETVGVFSNNKLVEKACIILNNSFVDFSDDVNKDRVKIEKSLFMKDHSTMENSYDVILEYKDYTFGCVLEYILYSLFFMGDEKSLSFVGFDKAHPHYEHSYIRMAFREKTDMETVKNKLIEASNIAADIYTKIRQHFVQRTK